MAADHLHLETVSYESFIHELTRRYNIFCANHKSYRPMTYKQIESIVDFSFVKIREHMENFDKQPLDVLGIYTLSYSKKKLEKAIKRNREYNERGYKNAREWAYKNGRRNRP